VPPQLYLIAALLSAPLAATASDTDTALAAIAAYEACLKSGYAAAESEGATAARSAAFDACISERTAIERALPPADVERIMTQVDRLAQEGLGKVE
jgi:hypothetical protein